MDNKNMETILVVDDTPENIQILDDILTDEYIVKIALHGEMAIDITKSESPDLILLDIMMPNLDGYEVCRILKSMEDTKDIPIIFITAKNEIEDETKGLDLGAIDYILKPVNPSIVRARVRSHLKLRRAQEQVKRQNEQLKKLLQLREDFVHMAIHDMRSPLCTVLGVNELLKVKVDEKGLEFLEYSKNAINTLNSLVNEILILARMENDTLLLNRSLVNLEKLVTMVTDMQMTTAKPKNISFEIDIPKQLPLLDVDVKLFQRLLDNLIGNAIKFSPKDNTIVIRIQYLMEKSCVLLQIIDNGPGIPKEERERVFDKYAIVELKKKGVSQVGLGLAFCKMVVESHGGRIYVTGNEPKGSIFNIEIDDV